MPFLYLHWSDDLPLFLLLGGSSFISIGWMPFLAPTFDNFDSLFALVISLDFFLHCVDVADQDLA